MSQTGTGWWLDQVGRIPLLTPVQEIELGNRVQQWLNHPDGPEGCPRGVQRGGQRARDQFVAANLRLAVSYVKKHCGRLMRSGYVDDLIQAANLGLIRAVEKYDPTRGYRFSTYAYWWIRQSVNRWIDQHTRMVSIPGSHSQLLTKIEGVRRRLMAELLREPTRQELASEVDITIEALDDLFQRARSHLSLDFAADEDQGDLASFIGHDDYSPLEAEAHALMLTQLEDLLNVLTPQQARVVRMRHGLEGHPLTPSEVAVIERVSARQIEKILREAMSILENARKGLAPRPSAPLLKPVHAGPVTLRQLTLFPDHEQPSEPSSGRARRRHAAPRGTQARPRGERTDPVGTA
jgi:RNA polymerase sigma factor (sigma-70 family)